MSFVRLQKRPLEPTARRRQRDISVAADIDFSSVRVAPPKKNSFSQDWP